MKIIDIYGGIRLSLDKEEVDLYEKVVEQGGSLAKRELDEREREVARNMVTRGALKRVSENNEEILFKLNKIQQFRRKENE